MVPPAPFFFRFSPMPILFLGLALQVVWSESSPLSIHPEGFGIGLSSSTTREKGMGEAGMASPSKEGMSLSNPSASAFHEKTSFTAVADGDVDWLKDDRTSNRSTTFLIPAIGLNFHLRKYGHLAFFYRQRYHRNFSFTPLDPLQSAVGQSFATEGGLYEAAVTYALSPMPILSIGIGFHYFLGRERFIESAIFNTSISQPDLYDGENLTGDTLQVRSNGGAPSLSLTFRQPRFNLGIAGMLGTTLDQEAKRSVTSLASHQKSSSTQDLPWTLNLGAALKTTATQVWVADFSWESWEDAGTGILNPAFKAGIGYEFQGRGGIYESYYRKLAFRGGIGFERLYLEESDLYYVTAGSGLPLGKRGSLLDIALKYGHRGAVKNNLWSEDFLKLSVSLIGVGSWGQSIRKRR